MYLWKVRLSNGSINVVTSSNDQFNVWNKMVMRYKYITVKEVKFIGPVQMIDEK